MALPGGLRGAPAPLVEVTAGARWTRIKAGESGGSVWRLGWPDRAALYLKHGTGRVANDVADEAARLEWLVGRLPTPAVRFFARDGDAAWLLTEAVPGLTGDERLARDMGELAGIVSGCATFMRRLHALPIEECPFDAGHPVRLAAARRNVAEGLVDEDDFDPDHAGWSAASVLARAESLAPERPERVVTHGDFSLGNILFDDAGRVTGCIDVGRLGVADPYQDIAILWQNLSEFGTDAQGLLLRELGIDRVDERRLLFHRCLDELF